MMKRVKKTCSLFVGILFLFGSMGASPLSDVPLSSKELTRYSLSETFYFCHPIDDIPATLDQEVSPFACMAISFLAYFKRIPITPIQTKKGVHPFSTYLTKTYPYGEPVVSFEGGVLGGFTEKDPLGVLFFAQQGIILRTIPASSSLESLRLTIQTNLQDNHPILLIDSHQIPSCITAILLYPDRVECEIYTPLEEKSFLVPLQKIFDSSSTYILVSSDEEKPLSIYKEIILLFQKRIHTFWTSFVWDLQLWFYREIDHSIKEFKNHLPFSKKNVVFTDLTRIILGGKSKKFFSGCFKRDLLIYTDLLC